MIIKQFKCKHCEKIHERKFYENKSEAAADIFTENYFIPIWNKMKEQIKEKDIEDFCKELVFTAVYHYHRNRRRIIVAKDSIEPANRTENQSD
jgi:hypothetical protein